MFERGELLILITAIVAIALSSFLLFFLGMEAAIAGFFMVIIAAVSFQFPRTSLYLFLIYLCFSGTITYSFPGVYQEIGGKVVFSSIYFILHLVKNIFYFPALIAIIIERKCWEKIFPKIKPLMGVLLFFGAVCFLNFLFVNIPLQFEAKSGSPLLMGIVGLKIWLGYIPLILCSFFLIRNRQDLLFLTRLLTVLVIICCALALIQYLLLISGICDGSVGLPEPADNRASLQARCFVGGSLLYFPERNLIRLPGTFVAPWQWGWFLISSIFFSVGTSQSDPSKKWQIVSWIGTILVLITSVISGQRIALLVVPIVLIALILLTEKYRKTLAIKLGIISFCTAISLNLPVVKQSIQNFFARWNYSPPTEFIWQKLQFAINNNEGILGHGLATTSSMARKLGPIKLIEVFYAQLIYEMGFLGLISFLALASMLVFIGFKISKSLQDNSLKNLSICLWSFILFISYNTYYYPLLVDPVAVYYWFVSGILFKLPQIDSQLSSKNK
jgi:cell division protein FtsW (lipid II flippase)